jgi:glycyl-tRNA synthetase beta chain
MSGENSHEYFFELLAEEIPASMHEGAHAALRQRLIAFLEGIGCTGDVEGQVRVQSTARRLLFRLGRLPEKEADRTDEIKGPPRRLAYDAEGAPTQALHGFLRKNIAALGDLVQSGDDYIRLQRTVTGRAMTDLLRNTVPEIVQSIRWPKSMRWGGGEQSYIRPVHSMISIFDDQPLTVTLFGTVSGTVTVGHRTLAPAPIEVTSYGDYVSKLELARVIVDADRRRMVMAEKSRALAQEIRGVPALDETIWAQWQYLTEYPGVVRAEFRMDLLTLPEEVLVTVMRVHQKQLPIRDDAGKLTNSFLAVTDNEADPDGNAAYGNSFVTNARFADASFFYQTDRKVTLESRLDSLGHLQFQERLGNYRQKTARIEALAGTIAARSGVDVEAAHHAARLSKCDLGTEMVKEFTELQGKIGGIYAREEGLADTVWQAVYDHYLPVNAEDALPRGGVGAVVSLADRLDTLCGFFLIGARPTGSRDPFGLRRTAQGIVQILLERDTWQIALGIDELVDLGLQGYAGLENRPAAADREGRRKPLLETDDRTDVLAFIADRVRMLLQSPPHVLAYDEVAAAMEARWMDSLPDLVERARAVNRLRSDPRFLSILDSAKRIANITAGQPESLLDRDLLVEAAEKSLHDRSETLAGQIGEMIAQRHYERALQAFAGMADELERFFADVMVNVDDPAIRQNRVALLRRVGGAVAPIADVTRIVVDRRELTSRK